MGEKYFKIEAQNTEQWADMLFIPAASTPGPETSHCSNAGLQCSD